MAIRLRGATAADTNDETFRSHRLAVDAYESRVDSLEDVRVKARAHERHLVNDSKVLEGRRNALLEAQAAEGAPWCRRRWTS